MTEEVHAGHNEAWLLDRANGYGTQKASTIGDLHDEVVKYRLDEFAQPTAFVEMNGQKLATVGNPSANSGDAANSRYVDSGSTYVVRTSGDQSVDGGKNFRGVLYSTGGFQRGTGSIAGTSYLTQYRITGATIPRVAWTNLPFNGNAHYIHDDGTILSAPDFHIPVSGMWLLSACVTLPVTPCYWALQWFRNPDILSQESRPIFDNDKINLTTCCYLPAGDVVTLRIYQDSGGNLTIPAHVSSSPCWASATLVA